MKSITHGVEDRSTSEPVERSGDIILKISLWAADTAPMPCLTCSAIMPATGMPPGP